MVTLEQLDATVQQLDTRIEQLDMRVEQMDSKFDAKFTEMDRKFDRLYEVVLLMHEDIRDIKFKVIKLEGEFIDFNESHKVLEDAEAKDAIATINHEKRIAKLERFANIEPAPVKHLKKFAT